MSEFMQPELLMYGLCVVLWIIAVIVIVVGNHAAHK